MIPTGQKTSIGMTRDGFTFQGPIQTDDYMGTIITGSVVIVILFVVALIRWGPKLLAFKRNGNGNKSESKPVPSNNDIAKVSTDIIQDGRLTAIENSHKDIKEDMRDIREGQNKIIERQGEIGGKVDVILNFIVGSKK